MKDFDSHTRRTDDIRWHLNISTALPRHARPVVVFVPGLGEGDYMAKHGRILAEHWRVLIVDMPGFGKTRGPKRLVSVEEFAAALDRFLRDTVAEPAFVVASSFGC